MSKRDFLFDVKLGEGRLKAEIGVSELFLNKAIFYQLAWHAVSSAPDSSGQQKDVKEPDCIEE